MKNIKQFILTGMESDYNTVEEPEKVCMQTVESDFTGKVKLPENSFVVARTSK